MVRIAEVLGVKLTELTAALALNYSTVARTPYSGALQEKLAPFANVIAMARPSAASAVEQWVAGAWLGEPA